MASTALNNEHLRGSEEMIELVKYLVAMENAAAKPAATRQEILETFPCQQKGTLLELRASGPSPFASKQECPHLTTQVPGVVELADLGGEARAFLFLDGEEDLEELAPERRRAGNRTSPRSPAPRARCAAASAFIGLRVTVAGDRRPGIRCVARCRARRRRAPWRPPGTGSHPRRRCDARRAATRPAPPAPAGSPCDC